MLERKNKHLLDTSKTLLFQSKLPLKYWGDCVLTATYLINRFPSPLLHNISPFEKLHQSPPSYDHLKSFGCLCFATSLKIGRNKFQARAISSIFLGYPFGKKGYKILNLTTFSIFYSRDVVFHEHIFPYHSSTPSLFPPPPPTFPDISGPSVSGPPSLNSAPHSAHMPSVSISPNAAPPSVDLTPSVVAPNSIIFTPTLPSRHYTRKTHKPSYLDDYVCSIAHYMPSEPNDSRISPVELHLHEPQFYHQVAGHPAWQKAMVKEFQALETNHTWDIIPLPSHKKAIPCKWVYKIK